MRLAKHILIGTAFFEGVGTILLASRFIPDFGWEKGLYFGFFHSVSAFCNAGFDVLGESEAYISFLNYANDWVVNLTLIGLIVIGGIGFLVWEDLLLHRWHFRQYHLHTKLVLMMTGLLIVGGPGCFCFLNKITCLPRRAGLIL